MKNHWGPKRFKVKTPASKPQPVQHTTTDLNTAEYQAAYARSQQRAADRLRMETPAVTTEDIQAQRMADLLQRQRTYLGVTELPQRTDPRTGRTTYNWVTGNTFVFDDRVATAAVDNQQRPEVRITLEPLEADDETAF